MRENFTFDRADRLADILFGMAAAGGLITYKPLAHQVGMRPDHLRRLLAEVSRRSAGQSGPIWTALAISARTGRPGDGFYRLARELRADCSGLTDEQVWQKERDRCCQAIPRRQATAAATDDSPVPSRRRLPPANRKQLA
jgi:hypothetical protein